MNFCYFLMGKVADSFEIRKHNKLFIALETSKLYVLVLESLLNLIVSIHCRNKLALDD